MLEERSSLSLGDGIVEQLRREIHLMESIRLEHQQEARAGVAEQRHRSRLIEDELGAAYQLAGID